MDFAKCQVKLIGDLLWRASLIDNPNCHMRHGDTMPRNMRFASQYRWIDRDVTSIDNRHSAPSFPVLARHYQYTPGFPVNGKSREVCLSNDKTSRTRVREPGPSVHMATYA